MWEAITVPLTACKWCITMQCATTVLCGVQQEQQRPWHNRFSTRHQQKWNERSLPRSMSLICRHRIMFLITDSLLVSIITDQPITADHVLDSAWVYSIRHRAVTSPLSSTMTAAAQMRQSCIYHSKKCLSTTHSLSLYVWLQWECLGDLPYSLGVPISEQQPGSSSDVFWFELEFKGYPSFLVCFDVVLQNKTTKIFAEVSWASVAFTTQVISWSTSCLSTTKQNLMSGKHWMP